MNLISRVKALNSRGFSHHLALMLVVVIVGIGGSFYLVLTHASTPPNCTDVASPGGSTLEVCANITSTNTVYAQANYVGKQSSNKLTAGSVTLYACPTTTLQCTAVASSNKIVKSNVFVPNKQYIKTAAVAYTSQQVYKSCVIFTDSTGWQESNTCTNIVTFGSGYGSTPQVYQPASTTTTTSTAPDCGNQVPPLKADGSKWVCSFNDEFSGTALDRTKWNVQLTSNSGFATTDTKDGNTRACYVDTGNNVAVSGGYLNLTARQESAPFTCQDPAGNFTTNVTSGEVQSLGKFSQQYGRFEVSAKLPSTQTKGLQETLWLWPNNDIKYGAWPGSGEYDFSEFYSKYANLDVPVAHYYPTSTYNFSTHTNTYTPVYGYDSNYNNCYINVGTFNTYTAFWQSGYLEVDVNGKPCLIDNYSSSTGAVPAPFDQPFFLALTQALGIWPIDKNGNHVGSAQDNAYVPGTTPMPATTQVDYVRVWK